MSSVVDSEHHAIYENNARKALPGILWNAFKLSVGIPDAGDHRTFKLSTFNFRGISLAISNSGRN